MSRVRSQTWVFLPAKPLCGSLKLVPNNLLEMLIKNAHSYGQQVWDKT